MTVNESKVKEYRQTDIVSPEFLRPRHADVTNHVVYDAGLVGGAKLHRFRNNANVPYSAIYVGDHEEFSCERDHERNMIRCWNNQNR